jgi:hypothetical protein
MGVKQFAGFLFVALAAVGASAQQQPANSPEAAAARQEFEAAIEAAQQKYIEKLQALAESAKSAEAAQLRRLMLRVRNTPLLGGDDQVAAARRRIENSTWNFDRPALKETHRMTFRRDGVWETTLAQNGLWVMATERLAIASYRSEQTKSDLLFLFEFDDQYRSYKVKAFADTPTAFVGGQRIK